jgi:hypothetical protein
MCFLLFIFFNIIALGQNDFVGNNEKVHIIDTI